MGEYLNQVASQSAFLPKYLAELTTGHEFFRNKPIKDNITGNEFATMPQFLKDFLELQPREVKYTDKNGRKVEYTMWVGNPYKIHLLRSLPTSRITSTSGQIADERYSTSAKLLRLLTGIKIYPIDVERMQEKEINEYINTVEDILVNYGVLRKYENTYEPTKTKQKTSIFK